MNAFGRSLLLALVLLVAPAVVTADASARPNILFVTSDDLGLQLGCYGDRIAATPHLDRFASEGVRFTQGYVTQASCSPSRSSMLTGLYPHQNGQIGLSHLGYRMHRGDIPTVPGLLKKAGYATGILGKLHVAPESAFPFDHRGIGCNDARSPEKVGADFARFLDGVPAGKPFFFMCNLTDPHEPFLADVDGAPKAKIAPDAVAPFPFMNAKDAPTLRDQIARYYTCANRADECFGRVMTLLDRRGLRDNTLVVFIGDHGPPFSRAKTTAHNAGNHIPFLVRWPGTAPAGAVRDPLVCTTDLMPTFLEAAGAEAPAGLPGRSLAPLFSGAGAPWRKYLATEFGAHTPGTFLPQRCIQTERWRLMVSLLHDPALADRGEYAGLPAEKAFGGKFKTTPHIALYDLKSDRWENKNLAGDPEHRAVRDELMRELQRWRETTADPFLDREALVKRAEQEAVRGQEYAKNRKPRPKR